MGGGRWLSQRQYRELCHTPAFQVGTGCSGFLFMLPEVVCLLLERVQPVHRPGWLGVGVGFGGCVVPGAWKITRASMLPVGQRLGNVRDSAAAHDGPRFTRLLVTWHLPPQPQCLQQKAKKYIPYSAGVDASFNLLFLLCPRWADGAGQYSTGKGSSLWSRGVHGDHLLYVAGFHGGIMHSVALFIKYSSVAERSWQVMWEERRARGSEERLPLRFNRPHRAKAQRGVSGEAALIPTTSVAQPNAGLCSVLAALSHNISSLYALWPWSTGLYHCKHSVVGVCQQLSDGCGVLDKRRRAWAILQSTGERVLMAHLLASEQRHRPAATPHCRVQPIKSKTRNSLLRVTQKD